MNSRETALFVCYIFVFTAISVTSFYFPSTNPEFVRYGLLALYVLPMVLFSMGFDQRFAPVLLFSTIGLSLLIVIDPIRPTLYGFDAYGSLSAAHEFRSMTITQFNARTGDRPLLYAAVWPISILFDINVKMIGKFLPLIGVLSPLFYYLALRTILPVHLATVIAFAIGGLRNFVSFQTRFIPEAIATVFFAFVVYTEVKNSNTLTRRWQFLTLIGIVAATLSHHLTSLMIVLFMGMWFLSPAFSQGISVLSNRFAPQSQTTVSGGVFILAFIAIVSSFIFLSPERFGGLIVRAGSTILGSISVPTNSIGGSGGAEGVYGFLTGFGALFFLTVFAVIVLYGYLHQNRQPAWVIGWLFYSGGVAAIYVAFLIQGRFVYLAPIRFLAFLIPILLGVVGYVVANQSSLSPNAQQVVVVILLCGLLVTQFVAISPHILVSDPAASTLGDGHRASSTVAAANWSGKFRIESMSEFDTDLWVGGYGINGSVPTNTTRASCQYQAALWRDDTNVSLERYYGDRANVIYDNGQNAIGMCRASAQ